MPSVAVAVILPGQLRRPRTRLGPSAGNLVDMKRNIVGYPLERRKPLRRRELEPAGLGIELTKECHESLATATATGSQGNRLKFRVTRGGKPESVAIL